MDERKEHPGAVGPDPRTTDHAAPHPAADPTPSAPPPSSAGGPTPPPSRPDPRGAESSDGTPSTSRVDTRGVPPPGSRVSASPDSGTGRGGSQAPVRHGLRFFVDFRAGLFRCSFPGCRWQLKAEGRHFTVGVSERVQAEFDWSHEGYQDGLWGGGIADSGGGRGGSVRRAEVWFRKVVVKELGTVLLCGHCGGLVIEEPAYRQLHELWHGLVERKSGLRELLKEGEARSETATSVMEAAGQADRVRGLSSWFQRDFELESLAVELEARAQSPGVEGLIAASYRSAARLVRSRKNALQAPWMGKRYEPVDIVSVERMAWAERFLEEVLGYVGERGRRAEVLQEFRGRLAEVLEWEFENGRQEAGRDKESR